MLRTTIFLSLAVAAGFAFATFLGYESSTLPGFAVEQRSETLAGSSDGGLERFATRLQSLEALLADEVARRESLEVELIALTEQLSELQLSELPERTEQRRPDEESLDRETIQARVAARFGDRRGNDAESRQNQLVEAGFSPDQAQRITARESELRLDALYAQYDAVRDGEPFDPRSTGFNPQSQLRQELGDPSYERYLEATGQSTAIGVQSVMAGSAGQTAGLQPGDRVVAYAGERVFNTGELNAQILKGEPGQPVVMDVLRDGQQIQVYVPRGPIGISSGRGIGRGR
jgi:C-terminal processing protease CtpA/Prc